MVRAVSLARPGASARELGIVMGTYAQSIRSKKIGVQFNVRPATLLAKAARLTHGPLHPSRFLKVLSMENQIVQVCVPHLPEA